MSLIFRQKVNWRWRYSAILNKYTIENIQIRAYIIQQHFDNYEITCIYGDTKHENFLAIFFKIYEVAFQEKTYQVHVLVS